MKRFTNYNFLYYFALIYLIFPIYYSLDGTFPLYMFPLSILFGVVYVLEIHIWQRVFNVLAWLSMLSYTCLLVIVFKAIPNIMFLMFLTNIALWKYEEKIVSLRFVSIWLLLCVMNSYIMLVSDSLEAKIASGIFTILIVTTTLISRVMVLNIAHDKKVTLQKFTLQQEQERQRISQDMHDTLGHVFVTLNLKTELAIKQLEKGQVPQATSTLQDIRQLSQETTHQIRQIIQHVQPHTLLEELAVLKNLFALSHIAYKEQLLCDVTQMPLHIQMTAAMLLREASTNILKHAQASQCCFILQQQDDNLVLIVQDNGKGFASKETVLSMQTRVSASNGRLQISHLHAPTELTIVLPCERG